VAAFLAARPPGPVADTHQDELPCHDCLAGIAPFAERDLARLEIPEALRRTEAHLHTCPECAEEYALLAAVLRGEQAQARG